MSNTESSTYQGFTAEERAAMKDHAQEQKKAARRSSRADKAAQDQRDVLAKIAEMQESDRIMAERVHAVITASAPALAPKLWYGMPAYALDGKIVCHFQSVAKFKTRYATLGFSDQANLDDGTMWAAGFALTEVTAEVEARISALVKQAVS
ncbi:iron chaperone [Streptosporangium sp. G11]|uniref:iron chaperone n=1 Tax=Streptosporangium sp. G11 TaxID=3436926 RepID=UPI003EBF1719